MILQPSPHCLHHQERAYWATELKIHDTASQATLTFDTETEALRNKSIQSGKASRKERGDQIEMTLIRKGKVIPGLN
jgi:hypothetical protein